MGELDEANRKLQWTRTEFLLMSRDLQESKDRLEEAQRIAHVGYWIWNLETDRVTFSDETYRIFGLSPQGSSIHISTVRELIHPEDREFVFQTADEAVRNGTRPDCEHRLIRPDGEVRIVHSLGNLKRDASGRPYEMFGTVQDITDRKRSEDALQQTQAHFREGLRLARMGSWTSEGSSCRWSEELFKIYGFDPRNGVPTTEQFLDIIHPQDRTSMADAIKMMLEQKRRCDLTTRIVRPNGKAGYVRCVGVPVIEQGIFKRFLGIAIDVTEHELLTQELRREKAYLAEAQSLTHTGSWVTNFETGQIFHLSDEVFRLHGFDPRQGPVPLERFYETIHPEDKLVVMAAIKNAIRTRTDYDLREYRICLPDGTIRFLRALGHHDPSAEIGEYIGITMDITERKRAEQERERLRQLEADLAHVNRMNMLGELATALAHEIKQPIAASITSANALVRWLAHDPPDLEKARAAAARIEQDGIRAADVIDHLRSFYKKDTIPRREIVNIKDIIQDMTVLLGTEAVRHAVTIHSELDAGTPNVLADRVQLQQVFMNLMLNAIEAMKGAGGELTIRSTRNPESQIIISIRDTGIGLPAENTERIFDAFHTTKPHGTGMGLAITRSIVESYGGRVWATPNERVGATFHFSLPIDGEGRP
jgi:PAS domain S-box-containing protein